MRCNTCYESSHETCTKQMLGTPEYRYGMRKEREGGKERERRLITKEIIIGTHAPRAVGLTIGLPPPHLHLLLGSYGRADARELHMPMAFLRDKTPKARLSPESPHRSRLEKGKITSSRNSFRQIFYVLTIRRRKEEVNEEGHEEKRNWQKFIPRN